MDFKSLPTSNEDRKSDSTHQTNKKKIKTSPKDQPSSTMTSDACKSSDVTGNGDSNVIIPKIKTSTKDCSSSTRTADLSKKVFQEVKEEKQGDGASGSAITKIPKSEQKLIKKEPDLYPVRLHFIIYTLLEI